MIARLTERTTTLMQRLEEHPQVAGATFAQRYPGGEFYVPIEAEGARIGTLAVFWRRTEREQGDDEIARLEDAAALLASLGGSPHRVAPHGLLVPANTDPWRVGDRGVPALHL